MLQKLLETQLSHAVMSQIKAGVGTIPKDQADELLTKAAQLDVSKLRGLIIISVSDLEDPTRGAGIDVATLVAGTPATLNPLLELASFQIDEKLRNPDAPVKGEVCAGCGEVHDFPDGGEDFIDQLLRRGPGNPLDRGRELHGGLEGLMLALALGSVGRKR